MSLERYRWENDTKPANRVETAILHGGLGSHALCALLSDPHLLSPAHTTHLLKRDSNWLSLTLDLGAKVAAVGENGPVGVLL